MGDDFIRIPVPSSIVEALHRSARCHPLKPIVIYEEYGVTKELTYGNFEKQSNKVARGLLRLGCKPGERIGVLSFNVPEFLVTLLAASKIGALLVPFNTRFGAERLEYVLDDCQPRLMIIDPHFWTDIEPIRAKFPETSVFVIGVDTKIGPSFQTLCDKDDSDIETQPDIDDDFLILYTAGTAGVPKGVLVSHRMALSWALTYKFFTHLTAEDRTLIAVPLFHQTGVCDQFVTAMFLGVTSILLKRYRAEDCLRFIEKYRPTTWVMVPTMLIWLMDHPKFKGTDVSSIRVNCYGGGPISPETVIRVKENFPNSYCYNVFGATETYVSINPDRQSLVKPDSVGLPVPYSEIRIVDESNKDVAVGEMGEILVRGDGVVRRYWNKPEVSKTEITDGWWHTGDIARMDTGGFLYLADRKKDVIVRAGENIYSVQVEAALYRHDAVLEAAVFGAKDATYGEVPKAVVKLRSGRSLTEQKLREFCSKYLSKHEIPTEIIFIDEIPTNPAGKIEKRILRQKYG